MKTETTVEDVRLWLGFPHDAVDRIERLATIGPPTDPIVLPDAHDMRDILVRLGLTPEAASEVASATPGPHTDPEAWWLIERLYNQLIGEGPADASSWLLPFSNEPLSHMLHLYVFLAAMPAILRLHSERDIPEDVTWRTLADLGLQVDRYRRDFGRVGFNGGFWLVPHFRGAFYTVGRLQYDFWSLDCDLGTETGFRTGDRALGVHIPAFGPLLADACDASIDRAREFFPRHFPDRPVTVATCRSWLLDPQLKNYLPDGSNIVRFQRRFIPVNDCVEPGDDEIIRFVFGRQPDSIDELPQNTSLERAVVEHLRSGKHWHIRLGWFEL